MSGGVDSSVTAAVLKSQGHEVVGGTMSLYEHPGAEEHAKRCCGITEVYQAKRVCDVIGISHYTFNMKKEFKTHVVNNLIEEYRKGRTPNPCVRCNEFMKFDFLMKKARQVGCDQVATGHYARIEQADNGRYYLKKGLDEKKDQSYFLYPIKNEDLPHIIFPLHTTTKEEVRALALEYKLPTAKKAESQDICFIPNSHVEFMENIGGVEKKPGPMVLHGDSSGDGKDRVVGEHQGLHRYTVGQRRGIGVALNHPVYVKEVKVESNTLVISDEKELYESTFTVENMNILAPDLWNKDNTFTVKVRYRSQGVPGKFAGDQEDGTTRITLLEPERGITPGQSAVFYLDDIVVAGGEIRQVIDSGD